MKERDVAETFAEVKRIIGKFAKNKAALETASAETRIRKDLGVSSANLVDVVLDFEEAFDVSIADDELAKINTLGDAVTILEAKLKTKAA
jgi:acyl carrier protein